MTRAHHDSSDPSLYQGAHVRRSVLMVGAGGVAAIGAAAWWRAHPRLGSGWVNRVVDPWLVDHGVVDRTAGEIGLIEHVGRKWASPGFRRSTRCRPIAVSGSSFPSGSSLVGRGTCLAAGHCRMQVGAWSMSSMSRCWSPRRWWSGVPRLASRVMGWLGFRYLLLHRLAEAPGTLDAVPESGEVSATRSSCRPEAWRRCRTATLSRCRSGPERGSGTND